MLEVRVLSPVAKVFPDYAPQPCTPRFCGLRNEVISFQLAFRSDEPLNPDKPYLRLEIDSPAKARIHARRVKYLPVRFPQMPNVDDNYLRLGRPGLYPDALTEIPPHGIRAFPTSWESLWIDFEPDGMDAGEYHAALRLIDEATEQVVGETEVSLRVLNAFLPRQTLIHTKWFHSDCLATYYGVEIFSEEYWRITENFVRCAVRHGINTILTPIHTPPLDTRVGSYRPTVQLVDVYRENGSYHFGFERLRRWVDMCKRCGVEYYEIAHLFSQ